MTKPNRIITVVLAVLVVAVIALIIFMMRQADQEQSNIDQGLLGSLKQVTNTTVDTSHLADGLVPPTNRWFSGIALNASPKAVFPLPYSFKPTEQGFGFGLPAVVSTAKTITGGYNPAMTLQLGADRYKVTRYDSVSVTLTYYRQSRPLATVTIAEGSPFISLQAQQPLVIPLTLPLQDRDSQLLTMKVGNRSYGLASDTRLRITDTSLSVDAGQALSLFAVAEGMTAQEQVKFTVPLQEVTTEYEATDDRMLTKLKYGTDGSRPTLYAALPGQSLQDAGQAAGRYESIYGTLQLYQGTTFTSSVDKVDPTLSPRLDGLSATERSELVQNLTSDVAAQIFDGTDTYFGGKQLYRAANLYLLARELGQDDSAENIKLRLTSSLDEWFDATGHERRANRYFAYDTRARGLVGQEASFGAEQFNDHHFHYGYFIYAAAALSSDDEAVAQKYRPFVRLLAEEIAAPSGSKDFPQWRVFDPYMGHSWASGYGQFDDGNNQESSSEAVMAWNGLGAWAQAVGDTTLERQSAWMLSREAAAAREQWIAPDLTRYDGYDYRTVGIDWGGKRDYATFFSAEPAAIFGIQLIPMSPNMRDVLGPQTRSVDETLKSTLPDGSYARQFGDYLLMYRSLADKEGALDAARDLPQTHIDSANSRTYMLAWIMSRTD